MKNYLVLCSFFLFALVAAAQESEYERLYKLSQVWIRSNEDAWGFMNHSLSVNRYEVEGINLYGDSLIIYEKDYENSTDYDLKYVESYFLVQKLTDEELVIHPLNVPAVEFLDTERSYADDDAYAARLGMYKNYLKELKLAGKDEAKRKAVLVKYKTEHRLDVDVVSFKPEAYYFEPVKIDSVDVSLTWEVGINDSTNRIEYHDLRWVSATNTYFFGYRFEDRKQSEQVVYVKFEQPVLTDVINQEVEEEVIRETPQDSLIRILNEAPAGWYTGKFAPEGIAMIQKAFQKYGVNKPHPTGDKATSKYVIRIYHEGKYTDYYNHQWKEPSYLISDFFEFLDEWTNYVRTFEKVQGKPVPFPIALKK